LPEAAGFNAFSVRSARLRFAMKAPFGNKLATNPDAIQCCQMQCQDRLRNQKIKGFQRFV